MPLNEKQTQLQKPNELEEFKKKHSEAFLYFLQEFEKWQELKKKFSQGASL